jgi:hypothetical protein
MSVQAGEILHVAGNNVIDRIQSAGLGNVQVPIERILEVGNRETVDKIPGEPDFTFSMESLDVSVELLAFLSGQVSGSGSASVAESLADGTSFDWLDVAGRAVNITSPWKDPATGSAGVVEAGHLIPGYYVTRLAYRYGVTDNASQSVDLSGGAFFYGEFAPTEAFFTGDGATDAFVTPNNAVGYRKGGADGSTFKSVFGVIVDGTLQTEDVDYVVTPGTVGAGARTITFTTAPATGADVRVCYFTNAAKAFPQSVHASTLVKPGAVRGRNIRIGRGGRPHRRRPELRVGRHLHRHAGARNGHRGRGGLVAHRARTATAPSPCAPRTRTRSSTSSTRSRGSRAPRSSGGSTPTPSNSKSSSRTPRTRPSCSRRSTSGLRSSSRPVPRRG